MVNAAPGGPAGARRLLPLFLPAVVLCFGIAAVVLPPRAAAPLTTYAGASTVAAVLDLAAGLGLLVAGMLAWVQRPGSRVGLLSVAAGVAWFGPDWAGWEGGPPLARSLGMVAMLLVFPLLAHLVLAFPGRVISPIARVVVVAFYAVAAAVSIGLALFRDPFLDPNCWRNCSINSLLVRPDQDIARALEAIWPPTALAAGLLLAGLIGWRLVAATGPARRVLGPVLVPGLLVAGSEVAYALALLGNPAETPLDPVFSSIFLARSSAVVCLAVGVTWSAVRAWRTRTAVSRFAAELGEAPAPGSLRAVLARTVGDPGLQVAYWLPESGRHVDGSGKPVDSLQPSGRTATPIVRQGKEVAVLVHDATTLDATDLERQIGAAARLAIENERLQAELLAQLDDLRASRARIVERADAERRRLERDLHDGAQQRLLALTYELRRTLAGVRADGEAASLVAAATGEAQEILADLRELAHGIFPAVLTEAGLGAALQTLADDAPLPVELEQVTDGRYPGQVETGAYLAVAEAVEDARRRNATHARVNVTRYGDRLVIEVRDDGDERTSTMAAVADRVWALGGRLEAGPTGLRAEIPCA